MAQYETAINAPLRCLSSSHFKFKMNEITTDLENVESDPNQKIPSSIMVSSKYSKRSPNRIFFQHLTTTAQACVILFVLLIISLCLSDEFVFFTWHPLLLSIGWALLMTEAILSLSKDNFLTGALPKSLRVRLHWVFQTLAAVALLIGFIVVYINKNNLNKTHFKSWHGILGLSGLICCIPTCVDGITALYHVDLRNYILPKLNKFIHVVSGTGTFAVGGLSLILSVYTHWFERHTSGNNVVFLVAFLLVTISVFWTLMHPLATCYSQLKQLLKRK